MIHKFALPDGWIPTKQPELKQTIESFIRKVKPAAVVSDKIRGLIVPHAGYSYSGQCAAYGYQLIKNHSYDKVLVLGIDHHIGFKGISVTKATHYETPLGQIPVDTETCEALLKNNLFSNIPKAEQGEHSLEIQLPFLQSVLKNWRLVPLIIGQLSVNEMKQSSEIIQSYVDENTLVIASSDFTHYGAGFGYTPFTKDIPENIKKTDFEAIQYINECDLNSFLNLLNKTNATICGRNTIALLMLILSDTKGTLLNYYTSSDLTGDFSHSVSYASIAMTDYTLSKKEQTALLKMARQTIKSYLKDNPIGTAANILEAVKKPYFSNEELPASLKRPRGVFVTLKNNHDLRGCIGFIPPLKPLYQAVMDNAVNSAVNDPRFDPMTLSEETQIDIEISVLSSLKRVKGYSDIVVGKHGAYMVNGQSEALFLPQVAPEQGWNREEMLSQLSLKATYGQNPNLWKDKKTVFYVFTAQVFGEKQ